MTTITRQHLIEIVPPPEGIAAFDAAYPDGVVTIDRHSVTDAVTVLGGPFAAFWEWAVREGLARPFVLAVGDGATVTGGHSATVTGGHSVTVMGGDHSTVTGEDHSTVSGGYGATVTGGDRSTVTGGYGATVSGGPGSVLSLRWHDGERGRVSVAYVGEGGIEPYTKYRLENGPVWVKA